jgi:hypothetical protein
MGNDMTVFQEGELEESFYKHHGPKDESWRDFFSRTYSGVMNMLIQPKRFEYRNSDLNKEYDNELPFQVSEFSIVSPAGFLLHCGHWIENPASKLWFVYLHTNTRSLVDAQEVLPICHHLGANLMSFDLPGCGKSQGNLSFSMVSDLAIVLKHLWVTHPDIEIVIWARGMSIALEYLYSFQSRTDDLDDLAVGSAIKYLVLDSPFISVNKMVNDASQTITAYGVSVPSPIVSFCGSFLRRGVRSKLGSDPYDVVPINHVPFMSIPCSIISARHDDYMPPHHGQTIFEVWGTKSNLTERPDCEFEIFEGKHFGLREKELILKPSDSILSHVTYRPITIEEQQQQFPNRERGHNNFPNRILFPPSSTIFRIPSGSSLASKGTL